MHFFKILFTNLLLLCNSFNFENYIGYKDFTYCGYSKKYAHLSFDDGPNNNLNGANTIQILDVLDELTIKASFFLVGKNINMYPNVAQEIVKRGHTVGSHSWTHRDLTTLSLYDVINEFNTSISLFKEILGVTPKYYRPPYGNITLKLMNEINSQTSMNLSMWNMDLNDWRIIEKINPMLWATTQLDYIQKVITSSSNFNHNPPSMIILGHDIRSTNNMIRNVVNYLKYLGYTFVDLDTCYQNWLIDKKPESPCINDFDSITNGLINVEKDCTQLASGLSLACIPNGTICITNPCGSPGCGLSCDNRNLCIHNNLICKPNCINKTCGDDGCGNSCGFCGTDCKNGVCIKPNIPDISKINLCRPSQLGNIQLGTDSIILNYDITSQWDIGMVIIYTVINNYKDIDKFIIRVYTESNVTVYGGNIQSMLPGYWVDVNLEYVSFNSEIKFTIQLELNLFNDPMKMCCAPTYFELSDNMINTSIRNSFNFFLLSIIIIVLLVENYLVVEL
jgi:peptidoglycan/xylan/chitin deacetylase (PgdA/CDA1 family)